MADLAYERVALFRKNDKGRSDGNPVFSREPWDRVRIPGVGQCYEPVDWNGNLTTNSSDKEYTGIEVIDKSLSVVHGFPICGNTDNWL